MDSIENINIIASAFDRIQLRKIAPIEVDFSLENITNLRTKLKEKGYIYIRLPGLVEKIEKARGVIDDFLMKNEYIDENHRVISGKGILLSGYRPITHHPTFLLILPSFYKNLVEGKELKHLMSCLLLGEAETLDTKWIRVMGPKEYTNTHADYYKFCTSPYDLYTCWMPLRDQGLKNGTICICEETHNFDLAGEESLKSYELPLSFKKFVEDSKWIYGDFKVGDLLIFHYKTIHSSFRNDSESFRMNCDTRWYTPPKK